VCPLPLANPFPIPFPSPFPKEPAHHTSIMNVSMSIVLPSSSLQPPMNS